MPFKVALKDTLPSRGRKLFSRIPYIITLFSYSRPHAAALIFKALFNMIYYGTAFGGCTDLYTVIISFVHYQLHVLYIGRRSLP